VIQFQWWSVLQHALRTETRNGFTLTGSKRVCSRKYTSTYVIHHPLSRHIPPLCSTSMEPAATDPARAASSSIEKRSLLGLEFEIDDDEEEEEDVEKKAGYRHVDHRRPLENLASCDNDDDELRKRRRLWLTYTGRRNLIALLPIVIGGLILIVVVPKDGK
jgi:hypothetical protein